MRAFGRTLTAASIAIFGALGFAGGAAAECDGPPPPFAEAIAPAKVIVIGDVVGIPLGYAAGLGRSRRFTIEVTHEIRGQLSGRVDINNVMTQPCAGPIEARLGDRIALALNATAFTPPTPVTGVAWIDGQAPEGFETTTIDDVYKLAAVPVPEPGPAAPTADVRPIWVGPVIWGLAVGAVLMIGAVVTRRLVAAR